MSLPNSTIMPIRLTLMQGNDSSSLNWLVDTFQWSLSLMVNPLLWRPAPRTKARIAVPQKGSPRARTRARARMSSAIHPTLVVRQLILVAEHKQRPASDVANLVTGLHNARSRLDQVRRLPNVLLLVQQKEWPSRPSMPSCSSRTSSVMNVLMPRCWILVPQPFSADTVLSSDMLTTSTP